MKNIFIAAIIGTAAWPVVAQPLEGVITYEVKINMHKRIPDERSHIKGIIPEYSVSNEQLFFNHDESLYKPVDQEPETDVDEGRGGPRQIRRARNEIYVRASTMKRVELREFMGKKYLIDDSIRMHGWKIENEVMDVNGYHCKKATLYDGDKRANIVAWYSDQFRPFLGPEQFHTLPGAVLLVDINEGERILTAKTITLRPLVEKEIRTPSAKHKLTEAEYRKMVEEQMVRMRRNGGNIILRN